MNKLFLKIGLNTAIQTAGKIISIILSIVSIAILTRYLGSQGYGNFTLIFTFVSFFSVIADFGLQTTMVREFSQNEHDKIQFSSFLVLKLLLIVVSSLIAVFALFFFPYSTFVKVGIVIGVIAVAISGITTYGSVIFQSRLRLDLVTLVDIITKIFTVGFVILFAYLHLNFYSIVSTVLLGNAIGLVITLFLLRDTLSFSFDLNRVKKLLFLSLPIGITSFFTLVYFKVDTIMLSVMKNSAEVGLYSLPYKILENLLVLWGFYMASVYPLLSKFVGDDNVKQTKSLLKHSFFVAIIFSFPAIMLGVILAPLAITLLGGESFAGSIGSLRILLFAVPFLFLNSLFTDFFFSLRKVKIVFVGMVIALSTNIILNLYFIPIDGFIGASYVTILSAIIFTIYCIILINLKRGSLQNERVHT